MSSEKVRMRLIDILPNDFPNKKSWKRVVSRFPQKDNRLLDLDTILDKNGEPAILIVKGNKYGFCARNGNHTLTRIIQLFGEDIEVSFFEPNNDWFRSHDLMEDIDWRVRTIKDWGCKNFLDFLKCCMTEKFYKSETGYTKNWGSD